MDEATLPELEDRLADVKTRAFELGLDDVGSFGAGRFKRVLWLGIDTGAEAASELAAAVEQACVASGLAPEVRPFRPHITLARARDQRGARAPDLPAPPKFDIWKPAEFILFQSRLGRGGAEYLPLRSFAFSGD